MSSDSTPFERFYAVPSRNGVAPPKASRGAGVPMVNMGDLFAHPRIRGHDMERVPLTKREMERALLEPGDLLFARRSLKWSGAGACSIFLGSPSSTTYERSLIRVRLDMRKASPAYFFYLFRSSVGREIMETIIEQTAVAGIKASELARLRVPAPGVSEQHRIAAVLQSLDDKIDSNERLCNLLATAISTLVRHRVIDIEPGSSWTRGDLTSIARFVNGRAFTKHANGTGRPILRIRELNGGISDATPCSDIDAEDDNIARHHDVLFSWSGSLELYRWHGPESLINQHIFKVLPLKSYPAWFIVEWLREHMPDFQRIAKDKATTMGHIKREHLTQAVVNIPPAAVIGELDAEVASLDALIGALAAETATLRALRDALLPKLISGEIRVSDTDGHVASVGVKGEEVPA